MLKPGDKAAHTLHQESRHSDQYIQRKEPKAPLIVCERKSVRCNAFISLTLKVLGIQPLLQNSRQYLAVPFMRGDYNA